MNRFFPAFPSFQCARDASLCLSVPETPSMNAMNPHRFRPTRGSAEHGHGGPWPPQWLLGSVTLPLTRDLFLKAHEEVSAEMDLSELGLFQEG